MTGQRKYWKSYAKSNLKGNWGIAIAAMLAVVAVNFIGNIFAVQLFPRIDCCYHRYSHFLLCKNICLFVLYSLERDNSYPNSST